jgi:hypothetical protein
MRAMPARTTLEFRLALAVGFLAMAALGASPAGIARVHRHDGHTRQRGLVLHEGPKLEEGPTREPVALFSAPSRDSVADAFEVLSSRPIPRSVPLAVSTIFLAMQWFSCLRTWLPWPWFASWPCGCSWAACPLSAGTRGPAQRFATLAIVPACRVARLAGELVAVLGHGDVHHPEVHPHEIGGRNRCGVGDIHRDQEEPFAVMTKHQVSLTLGMGELLSLVLADQDRNDQATGQRPEIHLVQPDESHDSRVVGDRGMLAKLGSLVLVPFVGFTDTMDDQDCGLCRKLESVAKLSINQLLCEALVGHALGEQLTGDPVRRLVKPFDGSMQLCVLDLVRNNLNLDGKLHR